MARRFWTAVVGIAAASALIVVPSALAAYTSAKLQVTSSGTTTTINASLDPNDDPTASVRIFVPTGTQLTTNQAPGTVLGPVKAVVKALDLAGADLPLDGELIVAPPGAVDAATVAACTGGATPIATWIMNLTAAGQQLQVPVFLVGTSGALTALGPAYMQICLPPPDLPAGTPGRATFGAKVYVAQLTVKGVFSPVPIGAWIAFWTPYNPGVGTVNVAATVASPAAIAPGAVTLAAKKLKKKGARLTGQVTQAGQGRGGAAVTIFGGVKAKKLKRIGRVKASANGAFTFKAKAGTFFKATAVAAPGTAAPLCAQLSAALAPIPCVNPTVNGFTAQSKTIRKK
jgi:hypothetical protein